MYHPPQNANLVKSMKEKFENIDLGARCPDKKTANGVAGPTNAKKTERGNCHKSSTSTEGSVVGKTNFSPKIAKKTEGTNNNSNVENRNVLSRQLSDPLKRNIKRTPAFRLDKNAEKVPFHRNGACNRSSFEIKVKRFNGSVKKCDEDRNNGNIQENELKKRPPFEFKPMLKSKSSHDFTYLRSKFNSPPKENDCLNNNQVKNLAEAEPKSVDISLLYTEPIPKSQRVKQICTNNEGTTPPIETIYNSSTLKLDRKNANNGLSDTLKSALRKPLPVGPAPKKPPRTFKYCSDESERTRSKPKTTPPKRGDAKYMLNKLEVALRNNRLRSRKPPEVDIATTSGEDSDDSLLFRSKSTNRRVPKVAKGCQRQSFSDVFSALDCSIGTSCTNPIYERVEEGNSSFFVDINRRNEPIYDEPIVTKKKMTSKCRNNVYHAGYSLLDPPQEENTDLLKPKTDLQLRGCSSSSC